MLIYSVYSNETAAHIPNAVIMSDQTETHFYAWLDRTIAPRDRFDTEQDILALLRDHPGLIKTHSWPEMRRMAEHYVTLQG